MEQLKDIFQSAISNQYVLAAGIVAVSLLATVLVDFVTTRFCRVLARRSSTTIDDKFIDLVHRPVAADSHQKAATLTCCRPRQLYGMAHTLGMSVVKR